MALISQCSQVLGTVLHLSDNNCCYIEKVADSWSTLAPSGKQLKWRPYFIPAQFTGKMKTLTVDGKHWWNLQMTGLWDTKCGDTIFIFHIYCLPRPCLCQSRLSSAVLGFKFTSWNHCSRVLAEDCTTITCIWVAQIKLICLSAFEIFTIVFLLFPFTTTQDAQSEFMISI